MAHHSRRMFFQDTAELDPGDLIDISAPAEGGVYALLQAEITHKTVDADNDTHAAAARNVQFAVQVAA